MSTVSYIDPPPRRAGLRPRLARWALSVLETPAKALAAAAGQDLVVGQHARRADCPPCPPAPTPPQATFSRAADIEPATIDPRRAPLELPAGTAAQEQAVKALHAAYPLELPGSRVTWTYPDDGARGVVDSQLSDERLRGTVAAYAAVLAAGPPREDPRPAGTVLVSTHGQFNGVGIVVEAVCAPDVGQAVDDFVAAHEDTRLSEPVPMDRISDLDDAATPLPAASGDAK